MEFIPITLIASTAIFAFNVSQFVSQLKAAGNEFEDTVCHFTMTCTALSRLKDLFESHPVQIPGYISQIQQHKEIFEGIKARIERIRESLGAETSSRILQKRALANGDLRQLTNQISALNSDLNFMATIYSCTVLNLVHDGVNRIEAGISALNVRSGVGLRASIPRNIETDISIHHVDTVGIQQSNGYMDQDLEGARTPQENPPGPIWPAATMSTADNMMEWDPLEFLLSTRTTPRPLRKQATSTSRDSNAQYAPQESNYKQYPDKVPRKLKMKLFGYWRKRADAAL